MPTSPGDTVWILIPSALAMLMTPGVALFYRGTILRRGFLDQLERLFKSRADEKLELKSHRYPVRPGLRRSQDLVKPDEITLFARYK